MSEVKTTIDISDRVKQFNAELLPLLGKYNLGLGAIPVFLPDGRIAAKPQLFDDTKTEEVKAESKPVGNGFAQG